MDKYAHHLMRETSLSLILYTLYKRRRKNSLEIQLPGKELSCPMQGPGLTEKAELRLAELLI